MTQREQENLHFVLQWWQEVIESGHLELVPRYQAETYIQHNPNIDTGRAGFLKAFTAENMPVLPIPAPLKDPPALAGARGEYVWILWERRREATPTTPLYYQNRVELLRVRDNQIQEHWDTAQKRPGTGKVLFGKSTQPLEKFDIGAVSAAERETRSIAIEAATNVYLGQQLDLADRYFAPDYIEHDPNLSQRKTMRERLAAYQPPLRLESTKPALALVNGDLVVMMWNVSSADPDDPTSLYPWNYFHVMRIRGGKVVEHWDPDAWREPDSAEENDWKAVPSGK